MSVSPPGALTRILLDESVPEGVRNGFSAHEVKSVREMGWNGIGDGKVLAFADAAAFNVMITGDLNIRYQNRLI